VKINSILNVLARKLREIIPTLTERDYAQRNGDKKERRAKFLFSAVGVGPIAVLVAIAFVTSLAPVQADPVTFTITRLSDEHGLSAFDVALQL